MNTKLVLGAVGVVAVVTGVVATKEDPSSLESIISKEDIAVLEKPSTDDGWSEDNKKDMLHIRTVDSLKAIVTGHAEHLKEIQPIVDKINTCPECVRYEIRTAYKDVIPDDELDQFVEVEFQTQVDQVIADYKRTTQIILRAENEIRLREQGYLTEIKKGEDLPEDVDPEKVRIIYE